MPATLAGEEIVTVVDDENRPVAALPRRRVRSENLPHRAAFIFVFDRKGRLLVQRRTAIKDMYPGRYDLAAGGVVAAGESYEACARRETAEELGIRDAVLESKFDFYYEDERNRCFGRVFACVHEGPFTLQPEEVADAAFHDMAAVCRRPRGAPHSRYPGRLRAAARPRPSRRPRPRAPALYPALGPGRRWRSRPLLRGPGEGGSG